MVLSREPAGPEDKWGWWGGGAGRVCVGPEPRVLVLILPLRVA